MGGRDTSPVTTSVAVYAQADGWVLAFRRGAVVDHILLHRFVTIRDNDDAEVVARAWLAAQGVFWVPCPRCGTARGRFCRAGSRVRRIPHAARLHAVGV